MISEPEAAADNAFHLADFDAVVFSDGGKPRELPRKVQFFAGMVVVVAHLGVWWMLQWGSRPVFPGAESEDALLIDFIIRKPTVRASPAPAKQTPKSGVRISPPATAPRSIAKVRTTSAPTARTSAATVTSALQLYNDDGSLRISAEVLADIEKTRSDERSFDFKQPGLERAAKLLQQQIRGQTDVQESPVKSLSDRELEVFQLIGQWKTTREIAEELHLSIKTIEYYREQIKRKLNLKNAAELTQRATSWVKREIAT